MDEAHDYWFDEYKQAYVLFPMVNTCQVNGKQVQKYQILFNDYYVINYYKRAPRLN